MKIIFEVKNDMKKVYCKNCKWYNLRLKRERFCKNKKNDCLNYKRKWYKVWIK
jgi:hypothetical protein